MRLNRLLLLPLLMILATAFNAYGQWVFTDYNKISTPSIKSATKMTGIYANMTTRVVMSCARYSGIDISIEFTEGIRLSSNEGQVTIGIIWDDDNYNFPFSFYYSEGMKSISFGRDLDIMEYIRTNKRLLFTLQWKGANGFVHDGIGYDAFVYDISGGNAAYESLSQRCRDGLPAIRPGQL